MVWDGEMQEASSLQGEEVKKSAVLLSLRLRVTFFFPYLLVGQAGLRLQCLLQS